MAKQLIAVVVVAVMLSTAIGFALGSVSSPQSAGATAGSGAVVRQLKKLNNKVVTLTTETGEQQQKLNNKVATLNEEIGEMQQSKGSVRGLLTIICDYTAPIDCK